MTNLSQDVLATKDGLSTIVHEGFVLLLHVQIRVGLGVWQRVLASYTLLEEVCDLIHIDGILSHVFFKYKV